MSLPCPTVNTLFQHGFVRRLDLPYTHANFPSWGLLFALVGLAVEVFGDGILEDDREMALRRRIGDGQRWEGDTAAWFIQIARVRLPTPPRYSF